MRIAMISPPWISTPPVGYGGIEYVVHHLTIELERLGHEVTLFTTGTSTTPATARHHTFDADQYPQIADPLYEAVSIPLAHLLDSLDVVRDRGDFDLIHDHTAPIGPALLAHADPTGLPPSLHTLHGPLTTRSTSGMRLVDDRSCYTHSDGARLAFNGISAAQLRDAPEAMRPALLDVVHNGLSLDDFPYLPGDGTGPFVTLARISRCKGHATAARLCRELGVPLRIAGLVPGFADLAQIEASLANAGGDLAYYRDELRPLLAPGIVDLVGSVAADSKLELLHDARALLLPIDWDEPFGLAAIEALACGTPVVAMRRGALAEIVEHGVNGFLADDVAEFRACMQRVDQIDPAACRRTVVERFSSKRMASSYVSRYEQVLDRASASAALMSAGRGRRPAARRVAPAAWPDRGVLARA